MKRGNSVTECVAALSVTESNWINLLSLRASEQSTLLIGHSCNTPPTFCTIAILRKLSYFNELLCELNDGRLKSDLITATSACLIRRKTWFWSGSTITSAVIGRLRGCRKGSSSDHFDCIRVFKTTTAWNARNARNSRKHGTARQRDVLII